MCKFEEMSEKEVVKSTWKELTEIATGGVVVGFFVMEPVFFGWK